MNGYVNDSTGYTPNYLMLGRELPAPDDNYIEKKKPMFNIREFREMMEMVWEEVAKKVTENVETYNRQVREPRKFQPYMVDSFVYVKRIPKQSYKSKKDEEHYVNSSKLQHRYAGPFLVVQKNSDVSYVLDIHGKRRTMHAINMKPV